MPDEQPRTGGFSHGRRPESDGFFHVLHPDTGAPLRMRKEGSDSRASVEDWDSAFALQKSLGEEPGTAWWPVEQQGVEGETAYAVYAWWKRTLSQDLADSYRCNPQELVAIAECLINGLEKLHSKAQRIHGALRPDCIVFPEGPGGVHDSLAPRLTGLVPPGKANQREDDDRRRAGHLLYAAITGSETNFRDIPDFGVAWSDVRLPGKGGWKKFIEELTSGNLDNEPYDQLRFRIRKLRGGKVPFVPVLAGLAVVAAAGIAALLVVRGRNTPGVGTNPTNLNGGPGRLPISNSATTPQADPAWLTALKSDAALQRLLGLDSPITPQKAENALSTWWRDTPAIDPALWLTVSFKAPAVPTPDDNLGKIVGDENSRRQAYKELSKQLLGAQAKTLGEINRWTAGLGWGQGGVEELIRGTITQDVSNKLRGMKYDFDSAAGPTLLAKYQEVFQRSADSSRYSSASFDGWSGLDQRGKDRAADNLRRKWRNDLEKWAAFKPSTLTGDEVQIGEIKKQAVQEGLDTAEIQNILKEAESKTAGIDQGLRLREYTTEQEARTALDQLTGPYLKNARDALTKARNEKGNAEIAGLRKKLDLRDTALAQEVSQRRQSGGTRASREALDLLRKGLASEKEGADFKKLNNFAFEKSETLLPTLEDLALEEEVHELIGPQGVDRLDEAISKLAAVEKREGFSKAKELKKKLDATKSKLGEQQAEQAGRLAREADGNRALAAAATARTNVTGALTLLDEQLKSSPGPVTEKSIGLQKELIEVKAWLDLPEFQFTTAQWTPPSKEPREPGSGWVTKYEEVRKRDEDFQVAKKTWNDAITAKAAVDQFPDKAGFDALNERFNNKLLTNKPAFEDTRKSLEGYRDLISGGEGLRNSENTNALSLFINKAGSQKPSYFRTLAKDLESQLARVIEKIAGEEKVRSKQQEYDAIKAKLVEAAKGVGGKFQGVAYSSPRAVNPNNANGWKDFLKNNRARYVALSGEANPAADVRKISKELDALEKAIQAAIDNPTAQ